MWTVATGASCWGAAVAQSDRPDIELYLAGPPRGRFGVGGFRADDPEVAGSGGFRADDPEVAGSGGFSS